ncbi:MAG: c-type cytochrome [Bacteroidota bacterium]
MSPASSRILKVALWAVGILAGVVIVIALYVLIRWDAKVDRRAPDLAAPRDSASVARGEYIFKYQAQCWTCHAAGPADATSAPSGGRQFDLTETGPGFGFWYSRNITPDVETGIGAWTDGEIIQGIREGVRKDRTAMFPLMPVDWYHGISDRDILALVAYLRSIPPVKNTVPAHKPSFFAKALFAFGVLKPKEELKALVAFPEPGETVEYGRYVASNLAGCMECHTPRNVQDGKFYLDSLGAGSSFAFGGEPGTMAGAFARNITPDRETGIGSWTEEQFITAVTTGVRPDGTVLIPAEMPYASYKFMTGEDLKAIYQFLTGLPSHRRTTPPPDFTDGYRSASGTERGKLIFQGRCQACHGQEGRGAPSTNVKLAEVAPSLDDADLKEFIMTGKIDLKMPGFGKTLSEEELGDLVAYIRSWGPTAATQ